MYFFTEQAPQGELLHMANKPPFYRVQGERVKATGYWDVGSGGERRGGELGVWMRMRWEGGNGWKDMPPPPRSRR